MHDVASAEDRYMERGSAVRQSVCIAVSTLVRGHSQSDTSSQLSVLRKGSLDFALFTWTDPHPEM